MNLFARKPTEDSASAEGGSVTQTKPSAPVSWKDFGAAQQRETDENRSQFGSGNIDRSICRSRASSLSPRPLLAHGFFYPGISPSLG
jgi:hypothetical protein